MIGSLHNVIAESASTTENNLKKLLSGELTVRAFVSNWFFSKPRSRIAYLLIIAIAVVIILAFFAFQTVQARSDERLGEANVELDKVTTERNRFEAAAQRWEIAARKLPGNDIEQKLSELYRLATNAIEGELLMQRQIAEMHEAMKRKAESSQAELLKEFPMGTSSSLRHFAEVSSKLEALSPSSASIGTRHRFYMLQTEFSLDRQVSV